MARMKPDRLELAHALMTTNISIQNTIAVRIVLKAVEEATATGKQIYALKLAHTD